MGLIKPTPADIKCIRRECIILRKKEESKNTFLIITGCAGSGKTSLGKTLARRLGYAYVDKDTVTELFTNFILKSECERESKLYCKSVKPIEYRTVLDLCKENLVLGNSVVLTIPFIEQIQNYSKWEQIIKELDLDPSNINVKFIWIKHNESLEYDRIKERGSCRDKYKLEHWEEYSSNLNDIKPDIKYNAFIYDSSYSNETQLNNVISWIL